jgi:glycosyltransferase involved in cell wall biosynthesis
MKKRNMVSFLIPIYNFDVRELVKTIVNQSKENNIDYEVLAYDDYSEKEYQQTNNEIKDFGNVIYNILPKNISRSKIRNLLAKESKGDWLMFFDCDVAIRRKDFIKKYLENRLDYDVICGGTEYESKDKIARKNLLHWKNGSVRESNKTRKKNNSFTTNNFFIKKKVFEDITFDETIEDYGHEDTIFGCNLRCLGYRMQDIDNPVVHLGLKTTENFIANIESATNNLYLIYQNNDNKKELEQIPLIKTFLKIKRLKLISLYLFIYKLFQPIIISNLYSKTPNLKFLDLFKLNTILLSYRSHKK